jgi:putative hydrolase of HD superfamily
MAKNKKNDYKQIANFLFEVGILAKTPRSGFHFLGTGEQSVAEHLNRVSYIGFMLAMMGGGVDVSKVLQMCMLHDISEARISDLNYVHQKYVERKEKEAHEDMANSVPFGDKILAVIN